MANGIQGTPVELRMVGVTNTVSDVVRSNISATLERSYTSFNHMLDSVKGGPVSIVGAGYSIKTTYQDLVGDVMACNSAHDFLLSKGIVPKYAMIWDANPIMGKIIKEPHPDVTYLLASRCHPSVFEKFKNSKVIVWHALGDDGLIEEMLMASDKKEPLIAGGSSAATRGLYVAGAIGYKEIHLFGVSDPGDGVNTHALGSIAPNPQGFIDIRVCGKWFKVQPWMAMQAGDFKALAPIMTSHGIKLIVHGEGLLPYTATFLGIETPDITVTLYEKIRREMHALILLYLEFRKTPNYIGGFNHAG